MFDTVVLEFESTWISYGALVRRVLVPVWERACAGGRPCRLEKLRRLERDGAGELLVFQRRELAALLRHAYDHVPFYRRRFAEAGVRPDDIRGRGSGPPAAPDRQDARAAQDGRSTVPPLPTIRRPPAAHREPLVIRYDLDSEYWRQAIKLRGFGWSGWRVGDTALPNGASTRATAATHQDQAGAGPGGQGASTTSTATPRGDEHKAEVVRIIRKLRPRALFCYARPRASWHATSTRRRAREWDTIRSCAAPSGWPADRAALEQALARPVFETYGCRETMLIAPSAPARRLAHPGREPGRRAGRLRRAAVAPGQVGEVVRPIAQLRHPSSATPNGDMAVAMPPSRAVRGGPSRLASVEGRSTETTARSRRQRGRRHGLQLASAAGRGGAPVQAVQHRDGSITIKVVPAAPSAG